MLDYKKSTQHIFHKNKNKNKPKYTFLFPDNALKIILI